MKKDFLLKCENFAKEQLKGDYTGHDWHHVNRVRSLAVNIATQEKIGDIFLVEAVALLHDIPDEKLNINEEAGYQKLTNWLMEQNIGLNLAEQIEELIRSIPFKGGNNIGSLSMEAKVVQDADRLDAIGAIGIARAFAYGGKKGQPIYDPELAVRSDLTLSEYRSGNSSSIHHFYEKLLKLKDLLHTDTAIQLAEERQDFMKAFLKQFYKEWDV